MILYVLLLRIVKDNSKTLITQNDILIKNKIEIQDAYNKLNSSYKDTIEALSNAIDARDPYTAGHSKRVSEISLKIGSTLGLNKEQQELLELSALFHDIGKLGIKDSVLLKNDKLTNEEFNIIKQHPDLGVRIISNIEFLIKTQDIIKYHHERFNGSGYPQGISGEAIPLESRIITVADSYDAMTSNRPYRKGMAHSVAISELIKNQNSQFDEKIVQAFLKACDEKMNLGR
jgi:putative nucleotidyltransferase with HDIG domain